MRLSKVRLTTQHRKHNRTTAEPQPRSTPRACRCRWGSGLNPTSPESHSTCPAARRPEEKPPGKENKRNIQHQPDNPYQYRECTRKSGIGRAPLRSRAKQKCVLKILGRRPDSSACPLSPSPHRPRGRQRTRERTPWLCGRTPRKTHYRAAIVSNSTVCGEIKTMDQCLMFECCVWMCSADEFGLVSSRLEEVLDADPGHVVLLPHLRHRPRPACTAAETIPSKFSGNSAPSSTTKQNASLISDI